jgi:predicted enzyme related to lactoylglutathione lyase
LQPDPETATSFYGDVFGWEFVGPAPMTGEPPGRYFVARLRGRDVAGVGSLPAGPPLHAWSTYISVASVEEAAGRASGAGGAIVAGPLDAPRAGRLAVLADPCGATFGLCEPHDRHGAQRVNEPSAWR